MSSILTEIRELVSAGRGRVSEHGFRELKEDAISLATIVEGLAMARIVEEYPEYHKGPTVLVLQYDETDRPVHVVWGLSKANREEAVLITAYRPDPARWSGDFLRRRPK